MCSFYFFNGDTSFEVHVIDMWNMTIGECGIQKGKFCIELPGRPHMEVQTRKMQ